MYPRNVATYNSVRWRGCQQQPSDYAGSNATELFPEQIRRHDCQRAQKPGDKHCGFEAWPEDSKDCTEHIQEGRPEIRSLIREGPCLTLGDAYGRENGFSDGGKRR
jgi:hypothetical protein